MKIEHFYEVKWYDDSLLVLYWYRRMTLVPLLTPKEAAQMLVTTVKMIHQLCREQKLEYIQINKKERRFTEQQISAYIDSQTIRKPIIDKKPYKRIPSQPKGGEKGKSVGLSRTDLREEIRSLCR